MRRVTIISFYLCFTSLIFGQHSAEEAPLPQRFDGLNNVLMVNHFPNPVYATTDEESDYDYLWKHTTSVMSVVENIKIASCGAYIFYNNQWNLRVDYKPKDFSKLFDCPKGILKKGQPYTFKDNWRTDNALRAGWAMWYFIGTTESGETVYGIGKIFTSGSTEK